MTIVGRVSRREPTIAHARLLEVLRYDPETGVFTNRIDRMRSPKGAVSGSEYGKGYRAIVVDGVRQDAHRWAWFYMTGTWPPCQVDHKDLDRRNNRWSNLRLATEKQNSENQAPRRDFLPRGIHLVADRWVVKITHNRKEYYIGTYDDLAEATHIRQAAERLLFTHSEAASC